MRRLIRALLGHDITGEDARRAGAIALIITLGLQLAFYVE